MMILNPKVIKIWEKIQHCNRFHKKECVCFAELL